MILNIIKTELPLMAIFLIRTMKATRFHMRAKPFEFEIGNKKNGLWYKGVTELLTSKFNRAKEKSPPTMKKTLFLNLISN